MVSEPVQQGSGEAFRPEHLGPLVEGEIGGDHDRAPFVALAEDLEEQFRAGSGQGHEAQFVDDQQAEAGQIPLQVEQRYLIPGFQRSALHHFHRRDASARVPSRGSPAKEAALGLLRGYDHLERVRWDVAQSVLVDVDALDDFAVLGSVHDLVLRVLGVVQRQSQLFHRFHLLVVRGTYPPKRVVYIEHNTNPEGGAQRPNTTG